MKIKAIRDFQGSLNGFEITAFEKGAVLDIDDHTAQIFLAAGFCEPDEDKKKKPHATD
jgi:hypothetical protein